MAAALFRKLTFHLLEGRPGGLNTSGAREGYPDGFHARGHGGGASSSRGLITTCPSRWSGGCRATDAEYRAHRRRHPCPRGMARRTAPARRGTLAACRRGEDRADALTAALEPLGWQVRRHPGRPPSGCLRKFSGWAERWVPRTLFSCVPSPSAQTRTKQVHCYPICSPTSHSAKFQMPWWRTGVTTNCQQ